MYITKKLIVKYMTKVQTATQGINSCVRSSVSRLTAMARCRVQCTASASSGASLDEEMTLAISHSIEEIHQPLLGCMNLWTKINVRHDTIQINSGACKCKPNLASGVATRLPRHQVTSTDSIYANNTMRTYKIAEMNSPWYFSTKAYNR